VPSIETAFLESVLRAAGGYIAIILLIRMIPKRQLGNASPHDLLGAIMVGGIAVTAIVPADAGPVEGLVMVLTIFAINFGLAWLGDRVPWVRWLVSEPPTCVVRHGKPLPNALQAEMLTFDELMVELRKQGVNDLKQVREAHMEADGSISVIRSKEGPNQ
jgi:uncharacterized membrane protein YcaP (DUF421 family)